MREFLSRHSSIYQWAVRPYIQAAEPTADSTAEPVAEPEPMQTCLLCGSPARTIEDSGGHRIGSVSYGHVIKNLYCDGTER